MVERRQKILYSQSILEVEAVSHLNYRITVFCCGTDPLSAIFWKPSVEDKCHDVLLNKQALSSGKG